MTKFTQNGQQVKCPYCGADVHLHGSSAVVYNGRDYGAVWVCSKYPQCNAYVGCHKGTVTPLGRLADPELRKWKQKAHAAFDPLWKAKIRKDKCSKKEARNKGYQWLADQMSMDIDDCHIGMFSVEQCQMVVSLCKPYVRGAA